MVRTSKRATSRKVKTIAAPQQEKIFIARLDAIEKRLAALELRIEQVDDQLNPGDNK